MRPPSRRSKGSNPTLSTVVKRDRWSQRLSKWIQLVSLRAKYGYPPPTIANLTGYHQTRAKTILSRDLKLGERWTVARKSVHGIRERISDSRPGESQSRSNSWNRCYPSSRPQQRLGWAAGKLTVSKILGRHNWRKVSPGLPFQCRGRSLTGIKTTCQLGWTRPQQRSRKVVSLDKLCGKMKLELWPNHRSQPVLGPLGNQTKSETPNHSRIDLCWWSSQSGWRDQRFSDSSLSECRWYKSAFGPTER